VYARHMPELREIAEPILKEVLEEDTELRYAGCERKGQVEIKQLDEREVEEWTDGRRVEGRAVGATRTKGLYLGAWATVADLEATGVMLAWEDCDTVALDSQGVI